MQFANPVVLWALFGCLIPIIIHLFRLRKYKIVYFSNTKILDEIVVETKKMSRLKNIILLILRVLMLAFLVIAFAKPQFTYDEKNLIAKDEQITLIYLDNSLSMESGLSYFSKFDDAKKKTKEIISAFTVSNKFIFLNNNFDASSFRLLNSSQVLEKVDQTTFSPASRNIFELTTRIEEIKNQLKLENINIFFVSDFQKNFFNEISEISNVKNTKFFVPVNSIINQNISIDSVWISTPVVQLNQPLTITALVKNHAYEKIENVNISLNVNGSKKSVANTDVGPLSKSIVEMTFIPEKENFYNCYVEIDDHSLLFDNKLYFSINIAKSINVTALSGNKGINRSLKVLFANDEIFNFSNYNFAQTNLASLQPNGLFVFDAIETFSTNNIRDIVELSKNNVNILIIPSTSPDESYNSLFNSLGLPFYEKTVGVSLRFKKFVLENILFKDVFEGSIENADLPLVNKYFSFSNISKNYTSPLIKLQNDASILNYSKVNNSGIYVFAFPFDIETTNFHTHAVFVPLMYRMALLSTSIFDKYYILRSSEKIILRDEKVDSRTKFEIIDIATNQRIIPNFRHENRDIVLSINQKLEQSGNFFLTKNDTTIKSVSFNYNRVESEIDFFDKLELDSLVNKYNFTNSTVLDTKYDLEVELQKLKHDNQLWKIFVLLALLCLIFEIILLRFIINKR